MKIKFSLFILLLLLMQSCVNDNSYQSVLPQPVAYTIVKRTPAFNEKNMSFTMDSLNNNLSVRLIIKQTPKELFPINNTILKDTLTHTAFHFEFLLDGKPVLSDYNKLHSTLKWDHGEANSFLDILSDTIDLKNGVDLFVDVPMYAFHNLKSGKQMLELRMWQDVFTSNLYEKQSDGSYKRHYLFENKMVYDATIKFDLMVPEIFKTEVFGYGLLLRNDSTFSSAGMDNTIWKSSYPDIYWCVVYPKGNIYSQTAYQTSTDRYVGTDTFSLYHYKSNDSIGFEVFDHDNLSRDDFLGYWWGPQKIMNHFPDTITIGFDNVERFVVSLKEEGPVN